MIRVSFCALVLALGLAGTAAQAANRHVTIINKTGMTLTEFYASNTGTNDWEEDILGRETLDDGDTFEINIDDGTGTCRFDFRAVFENGGDSIKNNVNVCQVETFTYTR